VNGGNCRLAEVGFAGRMIQNDLFLTSFPQLIEIKAFAERNNRPNN
jgi:hypothetical protein